MPRYTVEPNDNDKMRETHGGTRISTSNRRTWRVVDTADDSIIDEFDLKRDAKRHADRKNADRAERAAEDASRDANED